MLPIIIYVLISIALGCVSCLFGKKLYFPILMLNVFGAVATISLSMFDLTFKTGAITVVVGLAAALLARFFYKLGVFLLGGILGGVLSLCLLSFLPPAVARYGWIVILLFIAAAGICAVKWCDFFIVVSTSFSGAFTIAVPICFLVIEFRNLRNFIYADGMMSTIANLNQYLNGRFTEEYGMFIFLLTLLIALGGIAFQLMTERKNENQ